MTRPETQGVRTREITEDNRSEDEQEECHSPMRNSSIRFFTNRTVQPGAKVETPGENNQTPSGISGGSTSRNNKSVFATIPMPDVQLTMKANKRPPKTSQHKRALSVLDRNNVKTPDYYNQLRMKNNQFMQGCSQGNGSI